MNNSNSGHDVVVLSDDWNGLPTSTIHLCRQLLLDNRVFWMPIVNRLPRLSWADTRKVARVLADIAIPSRSPANPVDQPLQSPIVKTPFVIPWYRKATRRLNRASIERTYRQLCETHDIQSPVLITTFPSTADFVDSADAKLKVYYCVDDWLNYPGLDHKNMASMEAKLFQTVDAVVATSRILEKKKHGNCPSLYLPQGVDFEHFNSTSTALPLVPEMAAISKPIVGFFGLISEWIDLGLIKYLSREFPDVSFVLIGNAEVSTDSISNIPNIHLFGHVDYDVLPRWASYFDVGIIPFQLNELTKAVNPLKLMEYYALGIPVLSTRLPDLEDVGGPLFLCSNKGEFRDSLATILNSDQVEISRQAVAMARQNSWRQRANTLLDFFSGLLT